MYVEEEHFQRALTATADLLGAGACQILVNPRGMSGLITVMIDWEHPQVQETFDHHGLDHDSFSEARGDLEDTIAAVAARVPGERFATVRSQSRQASDEGEDPERAKRKLALAGEMLPAQDLQQRVWLKRTSKANVQVTVEWELLTKHLDDDLIRPPGLDVPFATVRIETVLPDATSWHQGNEDLTLMMDREDVAFTLRVLGRLQEAFEEYNKTSTTLSQQDEEDRSDANGND